MGNKKYLVAVSHPAQYHLFKNVIRQLQSKGHTVVLVIRPKDVLEQLCINDHIEFYKIGNRHKRFGMVGLALGLLEKLKKMYDVTKKERPDMLIGTEGVAAYVGSFLHIPSLSLNEDDADVVELYAKLFFPFFTILITPQITRVGKWEKKKVGYAGYQKMAYLHPHYFTPNKMVVEQYFSTERPYFILRLAQLNAYHDLTAKATGINAEIAHHIIDILQPYGDIYIISERALEPEFEKYRLHINPLDIHHIMAYATIYIGDSQSMAVEAAMLGTPSLRFNDFAGKISVLEELEHKYQLTFGIRTEHPQRLYDKLQELLDMPNLKEKFQQRRQIMLSDKIDVTAFFTWFFENYPESRQIMKENPDYQYRFK